MNRDMTYPAARDVELSISKRFLEITHYYVIEILTIVGKPDCDRGARNAVKVRRGREVAARMPVQPSAVISL